MGTTDSKERGENFFESSTTLRRSSSPRQSGKKAKLPEVEHHINKLKTQVDNYSGNRNTDKFRELQKSLTTLSQEIQRINSKISNKYERTICSRLITDINNCLKALENKAATNERNENNLDLAAVESNSFIHQNSRPSRPALLDESWSRNLPAPTVQKKSKIIDSLSNLERQTEDLKREIQFCSGSQNSKQLGILEKRVLIIYTNLIMVEAEPDTPLGERKTNIEKELQICQNQIKRYMRRAVKSAINTTTNDGGAFSKPTNLVSCTEREVNDKAKQHGTNFQTQKLELSRSEDTLEKLQPAPILNNEAKQQRTQTLNKDFRISQESRKSTDGNAKSDDMLLRTEQSMQTKNKDVQEVEKPSSNLQQLETTRSGKVASGDFQYLSQGSTYEETRKQLLEEVTQFRDQWHQLNRNFKVDDIIKLDVGNTVTKTFMEIMEDLKKKTEALSSRKTSSLAGKSQPSNQAQGSKQTIYYQSSQILKPLKSSAYQTPNVTQQSARTSPVSKIEQPEAQKQPTSETNNKIRQIESEAESLLQKIKQDSTKLDTNYKDFDVKLNQCMASLQSIKINERDHAAKASKQRTDKIITEGLKTLQDVRDGRNSTINRIIDINAEINYWGQRIKKFQGLKEDEEYGKITNGLSRLTQKLHENEGQKSKAASFKQIDQYNQELEKKVLHNYWKIQIANFNGTTKDEEYQRLSENLKKLQPNEETLMNTEVIQQIQKFKEDLDTKLAINQANQQITLQNMENRRASQEIQLTVDRVRELKSEIDKFSDVYKGFKYKEIEEGLQDCYKVLDVIDIGGDDKLENDKLNTKQEIHQSLRRLEDKSRNASNFRYNFSKTQVRQEHKKPNGHASLENQLNQKQSEKQAYVDQQPSTYQTQQTQSVQNEQPQVKDLGLPHEKINSLRDKLVTINDEIQNFSGNNQHPKYVTIKNQLINILRELENVSDRNRTSIRNVKLEYAKYVTDLINYFEDKVNSSETQTLNTEESNKLTKTQTKQSSQTFEVPDPMEKLADVEKEISKLKTKIQEFRGASNSDLYASLREEINSCLMKLQGIDAGNVAQVRDLHKNMFVDLESCKELLDENAKKYLEIKTEEEVKKIQDVLSEIAETSEEVNNFTGVENDRDYSYLDEILIRSMIKLDNIETYGIKQLRDQRKAAIREVQGYIKILTERAQQNGQVRISLGATAV